MTLFKDFIKAYINSESDTGLMSALRRLRYWIDLRPFRFHGIERLNFAKDFYVSVLIFTDGKNIQCFTMHELVSTTDISVLPNDSFRYDFDLIMNNYVKR